MPKKRIDSVAGVAAVLWMGVVLVSAFAPDVGPVMRMQMGGFAPSALDLPDHPFIEADRSVQVATPQEVASTVPAATAKAEPEKSVEMKEPLGVTLNGPTDALVGDMVFLTTEVRGEVTSFTWSIDPPSKGLVVRDGGRSAVFSNRNAQPYTILVSVAGNGGYSAHDFLTFQLMERLHDKSVGVSALGMAPAEPTVNDKITGWTLDVESPTKQADAQIIAGAFRSVGAALRSGQIATGENPLDSVMVEAELAMGPARFEFWNLEHGWFDDVADFLLERQSAGEVVTNEQYANAFVTIAALLEEAAARQ